MFEKGGKDMKKGTRKIREHREKRKGKMQQREKLRHNLLG